ncbi:MAG TPA: hypothetical protein VIK57_18755 [Streptosporangiaceae bacterium]
MDMKTAASTEAAAGAAATQEPGRGRRLMRGNPTLTLLTVALGVMMVAAHLPALTGSPR